MSGPSLEHLLATSLVLSEDWDNLTAEQRQQLERCAGARELVQSLADLRLLTPYQAQRIGFGKEFGLVLGNYRVLARLGTGGMGVVYKAEHLRMRRPVAIKVLSFDHEDDPGVLARFYSEIRAVAQLNHPNIVAAFDAGEQAGADPDLPVLYYFVMEYVEGLDLESYVRQNGPLAPAQACELMYQVASALAEAHRHSLVHRDIKPSNILVTPESQAKLLDFGLARQVRNRMTERGTVLGTVEYLAPE